MDQPSVNLWESVFQWLGGAAGGGFITAIVMLLIRWRKATAEVQKQLSEVKTAERKSTVELELVTKERTAKVDMDVHAQVVAQLTDIIQEERARTNELAQQGMDRELQWQDTISKVRAEHQDCIHRLGKAEGEILALRGEVERLKDRVEAQDARRLRGGRRVGDPPTDETK